MNPFLFQSALIETGLTGAIGTGIVFVEAGLAKVRHRDVLPGVIANYRLLPDALVAPSAAVLPIVELGLGLGLIGGVFSGGRPAAALLVLFAAAMAINIGRGRRAIDCGCGRSQLRQRLSWGLVARNLVLAVLVTIAALRPLASAAVAPLDIGLALVAGGALYLIFLLFNALAALAASPLASERR
jgi:uncharacterized membrane protein YphA (DoxX/SURF4 family)